MQIEITNATYGTKNSKRNGIAFTYTTGTAIARVTINGETREFAAKLFLRYDNGAESWLTDSGIAAIYPTGDKVHNVGLQISVSENGTFGDMRAGRSSMYAKRSPRCAGFFNDCANVASESYRR